VLPNQVYYFEVGKGQWGGVFDLRITDRKAYRSASLGLLNRLLVFALRSVIAVLGRPLISSTISVSETQGPAGTGWNTYKLGKWGVTLCVFNDVYHLDVGGENVTVTTDVVHYQLTLVRRREFRLAGNGDPPLVYDFRCRIACIANHPLLSMCRATGGHSEPVR
jgi:hypothetical protein